MSKNTRQRVFGDDATDAKTRLPRLEDPCDEAFSGGLQPLKGIESSPLKPTSLFIFSNEHRNTTLFVKDGYIPAHRSAFDPPSEQCQSTLV